MVSSGVPFLDRFLGGFQLGDNVVWAVEAGTFQNNFIYSFLQAQKKDEKKHLVYVNSNYAPQTIRRRYESIIQETTDGFFIGKYEENGKSKSDRHEKNMSFTWQTLKFRCQRGDRTMNEKEHDADTDGIRDQIGRKHAIL